MPLTLFNQHQAHMTIALIDDHLLLIEAMKRLLVHKKGIDEVKVYSSAKSFLKDNIVLSADIIIADLSMPEMDGMKLLEICVKQYKGDAKVIIMTTLTDVQTVKQTIKLGAKGFVTKDASIDELVEAINEVNAGKQYLSMSIRESLLNNIFTEQQLVSNLSPKERDILNRICKGLTIKEAAYDLNLSISTVQYYYRSMMSKLKVKKTSDLIVFAIQNGLYEPGLN